MTNQIKLNNGYALPFVLFITILIVSLLMGMLSILFFLQKSNQKAIIKKKIDLACYSAVQVMLSRWDDFPDDTTSIEADNYLVKIEKMRKGLFYEVTAFAHSSSDSTKAKFLIASRNEFPNNTALYISKPELRATITGNTKITGDIFATSERIITGRIFGIDPPATDYLKGKIIKKEQVSQKIFNDSLFLASVFSQNKGADEQLVISKDLYIQRKSDLFKLPESVSVMGNLYLSGEIQKAKNQSPKQIFVSGSVIINDNTFCDSEIELICDSTVSIGENVKLKNIIITSGNDITTSSFGYYKNVQLFSSHNIILKNCQFDFPSIICSRVDLADTSSLDNRITLASTVVNGTVLMIASATGMSQNKSMIDIDKSSAVQGLVYSENLLRMTGNIYGLVYTMGFYYFKEPTEYINWLVDVKINREKLSNWYVLPFGFKEMTIPEIVKEEWIY